MSRLPYQPGELLLHKTPILTTIVKFIADDEGWASVQFSDDSWGTVRPSYVAALDMTAFHTALAEYERRMGEGDPMLVDHIHGICHDIKHHLGIEACERLDRMDAFARQHDLIAA